MGGAFGPRNIALDHVNGEYLMFIDSDDTYPQDACETLYNKINEYDCDIAFGRYLRHYPEKDWKILEALPRKRPHSKIIHPLH